MKQKKWIEVFPYGVTVGPDQTRPMMLFKDADQQKVLPVWLSPLDAGIALQQNGLYAGSSSSPYHLTWKVLKPLGIFLKKCYFTDVKGHHQFVELHFEGHPKLNVIESRADEAVSFCLSVNTKFFCEHNYFDKCRVLESEINSIVRDIKKHPGIMDNRHPYVN